MTNYKVGEAVVKCEAPVGDILAERGYSQTDAAHTYEQSGSLIESLVSHRRFVQVRGPEAVANFIELLCIEGLGEEEEDDDIE